MPANTSHGLPYPLGTDRVMDGDNAIRSLAEALDPVVRTTGLVAQTGWGSVSDVRMTKIGQLCIVHFQIQRTGADLGSGAGGGSNIGDVPVVGGIPSDMVPPTRVYGGVFSSSAIFGGGRLNGVSEGASAGQVVITTLSPGTLSTSTNVDFDITYLLA